MDNTMDAAFLGAGGFSRRLALVLAFALAVVLLASAIFATPNTAYAADGNAVGAVIAKTDPANGTLEYTVTAAAADADHAGTAKISEGTAYTGADLKVGTVSQKVNGTTYQYVVNAVGANAFSGNTALASIEFTSDLTGASPAIGANAFAGCTSLKSVAFPQKVAALGASAFSGCTALATVSFPTGSELYVDTRFNMASIGGSCFAGCTALASITIPKITTSERKSDFYSTFAQLNPSGTYFTDKADKLFMSGYQKYWHNGNGPVARAGIGGSAFSGCTALSSVVFEAGADNGMFAYWTGDNGKGVRVFYHCPNLKSLVYESSQAYWGNENASMRNGTFSNMWKTDPANTDANADHSEDDYTVPTMYYAVDYYAATDSAVAKADDAAGNSRLARVEYARGTSTAAIACSDAAALAGSMYDASAYRQKEADGTVPDPNAAAAATGLDTTVKWAWKLDSTQSRRTGLTDSCSAYLVPVQSISAGHISADQIAALYKACDQNLSQGSVQDTAFDPYRYYNPNTSGTDGSDSYQISDSAWFTLSSSTEKSFYDQIKVCAADGTVLDAGSYAVSFQRYDSTTKTYAAAELGDADGPLLMTVTPTAASGYTGMLQEWVLVKGQTGSVMERYTDTSATTWHAAVYYAGDGDPTKHVDFSTSPYAVSIGSKDAGSALVASGIAGLVKAPISVGDTSSSSYGFAIATSFLAGGTITGGETTFKYDSSQFSTLSAYAVSSYNAFNAKRNSIGASVDAYPWGDTAVLVAPGSLDDVAAAVSAYAYAKKAPVFYAEDDGTVSDSTLACLKQFSKVTVIGDASLFSDDALAAVQTSLGSAAKVSRICGSACNASTLSTAAADALVADGAATRSTVAVSDAADPIDAISALSLAGHNGGISLVSGGTAESKAISAYLREHRDEVSMVRLFGRSNAHLSSSAFNLCDSLSAIWSDSYQTPASAAGDTVMVSGAQYTVGQNGKALTFAQNLYPHGAIAPGTYPVYGTDYTLAQSVAAWDPTKTDISTAVVTLPQKAYAYTGLPWAPVPTAVTLDNVALVSGTDYTVSYSDNTNTGTATVTVTGKGKYTGTASTTFAITSNGGISIGTLTPVISWQSPTSGAATGSGTNSGNSSAGTSSSAGTDSGTASGGTLTVGTSGSTGALTTGASTSGSGGSLNLSLDTSEDDSDGASGIAVSSGNGDSNVTASDAQSAWDGQDYSGASDGGSVAGDNAAGSTSSSLPPATVGIIVAAVVAAIGASIGFALRRRPDDDIPMEA